MMNLRSWRRAVICPSALVLLLGVSPVLGQVTSVSGSAEARVVQFVSGLPVQTDFGQEVIPLTKSVPPAVGRAKLDHLNDAKEVTAAGQGVAVMYEPNTTGLGNPNDVGLSIGAFSDDASTSWTVEGGVTTTRTLVLTVGDVGGQPGLSGVNGRGRSRLVLSGYLLIFSQNPSADLTGNEISFSFSVERRQTGRSTTTPLSGEITMVGGPDGSIDFPHRAGALSTIDIPVADFPLGDEFPLVRAVIFQGVQFPYVYDITLGSSFDLELNAAAKVTSTPGGIGAWALFGLPQDEITSIVGRVKKDDRGERLTQMLAEHVDTTGAAYADAPTASLIPACGVMGFELVGLTIAAGGLAAVQAGRRRRRR